MQTDFSTTPLYVGIDIGKNVHCYGGYAGGELKLIQPRQEVRNNQTGYETFRTWLQTQITRDRYHPIRVGLEPTGIYHEAWAYALQQDFGDQIDLRFLNPYQTRKSAGSYRTGGRRKPTPLMWRPSRIVYAMARGTRPVSTSQKPFLLISGRPSFVRPIGNISGCN